MSIEPGVLGDEQAGKDSTTSAALSVFYVPVALLKLGQVM